ncbi:alpha/beta hydrolase [Actinacidiphila glaucinigra]|uniref:alpha/beta fold hydrolase n=1 Tax=Actinacidiphila glaucinigra TaxID=235986 RepID=UPI002DD889FD|nr:alpha/beta hydrolase [Actinacidiphila glaucinigra]WSD58375.1 alpha/beta hydrolase [Actinacidiphila glaucinigra]
MPSYVHTTAPTRYAEVNGDRYAYRRFGAETGTPLLMLPHFRAGMDHWDPLVTDGLAENRPVILFDNAGVGNSGGRTPESAEGFAANAVAFLRALGVREVDLLGFSVGGYVSQALVLAHPELVRRPVLVGTRPRAGETAGVGERVAEVAAHEVLTEEDCLYLFFDDSPGGRRAGRDFWARRHERTADADAESGPESVRAQQALRADWNTARGERFTELRQITRPTLVVNGRNDIMVQTVNSWILAQHIPHAQLVVYPDSGHGALFQYPRLFCAHVARFLDSEVPFT